MKRLLLSLVAVLTLLVPAKADHDRPIAPDQLPAAAKTFIQQNFPDATIAYAQVEKGFAKTKYEVRLSDGTQIDFDGKGVWDKVDGEYKAVPAALVPEAIATYVQGTFPGAVIVKIDKERYGYDVELNNDLELKFNAAGQLMYMDD